MTDKRKVTLISRESDNITLDFKLLREELESRGIEVEVLTKMLRKELSLSALGYIGHLGKQIRAMNDSGIVLVDTYCIPVSMLKHKKDLKVVQMWHALSAIKKFGWQTVGKEDGSSEKVAKLMKMHKGYDYVLCPSDVTAEYFCEGFNVNKDKIVKLGLPRIDYILNENAEVEAQIRRMYPELSENKKTILYAPTFHKGAAVDVKGLVDAIDLDRYNVIVKLHPIDKASSEHVVRRGVMYDDQFDTYDLMRVADIIVSDYSSLVVEASLTRKPLYLYIYDEASYGQTTGLNMHFGDEAIGRYAFRDAKDLAAAMEEEYDVKAIETFRDKYIDIDTEDVTKQLADFIEGQLWV